ncbi:hypothetical protein AAG906_021701 [Vitis piasezkii]
MRALVFLILQQVLFHYPPVRFGTTVPIVDNIVSTLCTHVVQPIIATMSHLSSTLLPIFILYYFQEPSSIRQALQLPHWKTAMKAEYSPLNAYCPNKWIFKTKLKTYGSLDKFKADWLLGFQQHVGVDFSHAFSLVVKASTIRIILLLLSLQVGHTEIDINNAFLNGILHKDVYMCQPEGFVSSTHPTHVCKDFSLPFMIIPYFTLGRMVIWFWY